MARKKGTEPEVIGTGDGTSDDVIRAHIRYKPGAESVEIRIKYWDEVKAMHIKTVEVDADEIANVLNVFLSKSVVDFKPSRGFMESLESVRTKKEGRADINKYNGATGVSEEDEIYELSVKIQDAYANGEKIDYISELQAELTEKIEYETNEINEIKGKRESEV